jgi:cbb3-type cytochrome oxidase maturation protein
MSIMYVIVPLALLVVLAAVVAYLWAARHGQFDDLTTPALRMLHDEPPPAAPAAAQPPPMRPAAQGGVSPASAPLPTASDVLPRDRPDAPA